MRTDNFIRPVVVWAIVILLTSWHGISFGADPIKIGIIYDMSGATADYGISYLKGHEVARDEYNASGGILGRQIKYFVRDHKMKSDVARRVAEELVLKEKVSFLLGISITPCGFAVSEVAKQYKVLLLDNAIKSPELTEEYGHRYVATVAADSLYEGGAMAFLQKIIRIKNIGCLVGITHIAITYSVNSRKS